MIWDQWVLDVTLTPPCFVPLEGDPLGEHSLVFGMNVLSDKPPSGKLIGVVHMDGQEACDRWCAENEDELKCIFEKANA